MTRSERTSKRRYPGRILQPIAPLLTFPEAAERLGVPVSALYQAWHDGRFRANDITGQWRIEPDKLEEVRAALSNGGDNSR